MKTSLSYIDDVMERAVASEAVTPKLSDAQRADALNKGRKIIGGFRIHDEEAECKALDEMIAARKAQIETFRTDRKAVRDKLSGLGITPLAICPTGAWRAVCKDAGLFVLAADAKGRVGISRDAFKDLPTAGILKRGSDAEKADAFAYGNWKGMLARYFPDGVSIPASYDYAPSVPATLILPDPPADVAAVLCKAQSLKLMVAAEADAISFAEKPSDLMKAANTDPKDLWAQQLGYKDHQDWVQKCPIIFTEHGTAAAVIAQFGDFPIEKDVVDAVVASDRLIPEKGNAVEEMAVTTGSVFRSIGAVSMSDLLRQVMEAQRAAFRGA